MSDHETKQHAQTSKLPASKMTAGPIQKAGNTPLTSAPALQSNADALALQRSIGNQRTTQLIQAKLTVGAAHDPLEHEADRVADQVVRGATSAGSQNSAGAQQIHRNADEEDELQAKRADVQRNAVEDDELMTKRDASSSGSGHGMHDRFDAGSDFEQQLGASGSGAPLDRKTRSEMEAGIGADFSQVRIHTDAQASQLNRSISARAFTRGSDVFFDRGQYNPASTAGKHLLAHELTHVVQQGGAAQGAQRKAYPHSTLQRKLYVGGQEMEDAEDDTLEAVDRQQGNVDSSNPAYRSIEGGVKIDNVDTAWKNVLAADPGIKDMGWWAKRSMKARLKKWITRGDMINVRGAKAINALFYKSEERRYESWADVATALAGEEKAKPRKSKEKDIAKKVAKKNSFRRDLGAAMKKIHDWIDMQANADEWWDVIEKYKAKFPRWYPRGQVKARMANPVLNRVSSNFIIIHEVMFALAKSNRVNVFAESEKTNKQKLGTVSPKGQAKVTGKIGAGSGEAQGRHAVIEKNAWVKAARSRNMPLGAGASNTTHLLMTFSNMLNLSATDKTAIAWGAFVFWNKTFYQVEAIRHTFHEIMDVASLATGGEVDYDPDAVNPYDVGYNKAGGNPLTVQTIDSGIPVDGENVTEEQSQQIELPDSAPKDVLPTLDDMPGGTKDDSEDSSEDMQDSGPTAGVRVTLRLESGKTLKMRDEMSSGPVGVLSNGATISIEEPAWPNVPDFQNVLVKFGNVYGVLYADELKAALKGSEPKPSTPTPKQDISSPMPGTGKLQIVDDSEDSSEMDADLSDLKERSMHTLKGPIALSGGRTWLDAGVQIMIVKIEDDMVRVDANTKQIGPRETPSMRVPGSALMKAING